MNANNNNVPAISVEEGGNLIVKVRMATREDSGYCSAPRAAEDILKTFIAPMRQALTRRINACERKVLNHMSSLVLCGGSLIQYKREDGSIGVFNLPSYDIMFRLKKSLDSGDIRLLLRDCQAQEQILKALLNDTEPHVDTRIVGSSYSWSDLISTLMECYGASCYERWWNQNYPLAAKWSH